MKRLRFLLFALLTLTAAIAIAQTPTETPPGMTPSRPRLTKFDLDFPGGTPGQLVTAIQQATKRPLNVIIPSHLSEWKLPPLKMNNVDVPQLFRTVGQATTKSVRQGSMVYDSGCGFRTYINQMSPGSSPNETDDSIWYFYASNSPDVTKVSRFYYLAPYLQGGLTVDDITTAIQTGWKMRGEANPPALSFHKETKLLIAFGDYDGLDVIDSVLKALDSVKPKPPAADKPAPDPKTKP